MQKPKTKRIFFVFICALLSTVFAFTIGHTFAAIDLLFNYGTDLKSPKAYMGNNQYVLNNDTELAPVAYSVGSHATEISLQYAIDYEFDLRVRYSLDWLGDEDIVEATGKQLSTNNVKLLFANRDNVIVDDTYIYFINYKNDTKIINDVETEVKYPCGITKGNGKISIIAGVEIIETNNNDYLGKSLKINIEEVKIKKSKTSGYTQSDELYYSGSAGVAWLRHKTSADTSNQMYMGSQAYVMVYNYRYNLEQGVAYPGHTSAYSKLGEGEITGNWLGGNRAFAGVGLYIITGNQPIKLSTKVVGTWQDNENSTSAGLQFDNSIRFNYAKGWKHLNYDQNKLFETCYYDYVIPANTACYVDIVESVEITCAHNVAHNNFDAYTLVVYEMYLNNVTFKDAKITSSLISTATELFTPSNTYENDDVSVVNTSIYSNNIYEYQLGSNLLQSYSNSTVLLINNTAEEQQILVDYSCYYYISNGAHALVLQSTSNRATQFTDAAYFRDGGEINSDYCSVPTVNTFVLAPYSSVNIGSQFSVYGDFQTSVLINSYNCHDAWVQLNVEVQSSADLTNKDVSVEVAVKEGTGFVRIKNNTNRIIENISANIKLLNYKLTLAEDVEMSKPNDWDATFWRYYSILDGKAVQNEIKDWRAGVFYKGSYKASKIGLLNLDGSADENDGIVSLNGINLKPNESMNIYKFVVDEKSEILNKSSAYGDGGVANTIELVAEEVSSRYLINYSANSYFVRLTGIIPENYTLKNTIIVDNYIYFTMVIRPGQIIEIPNTITGIDTKNCDSNYIPGDSGSLSGWDDEIINIFDLYFT